MTRRDQFPHFSPAADDARTEQADRDGFPGSAIPERQRSSDEHDRADATDPREFAGDAENEQWPREIQTRGWAAVVPETNIEPLGAVVDQRPGKIRPAKPRMGTVSVVTLDHHLNR